MRTLAEEIQYYWDTAVAAKCHDPAEPLYILAEDSQSAEIAQAIRACPRCRVYYLTTKYVGIVGQGPGTVRVYLPSVAREVLWRKFQEAEGRRQAKGG